MSQDKSRYFEPLPPEVLITVGDWLNPLPQGARVDIRAHLIGRLWFQNLNQNIIDQVTDLKSYFDKDMQLKDPIRLFMALKLKLHDKAKKLNCDIDPPFGLNPAEEISWECAHLLELINRLK